MSVSSQREVVWADVVQRPIVARCRAILEPDGRVTFWVAPRRSTAGGHQWVRLVTAPAEYLEYTAMRLLVERELLGVGL